MLAKVDEMFGKTRVREQLFLIYDNDNIRNNCSLVPTIHELERQEKKLLEKCQHEKKKELLEKDTIVNAWVDIKK